MKLEITVNNYQLGAIVKSTPTHKITSKTRIDRYHTVIIYNDITENEYDLLCRLMGNPKKVKVIEEQRKREN